VSAVEQLWLSLPQLVLLDFVMPDMDGVQVLRRLKANRATADIPVVFLTGAAQQERVDFFRHEGAVEVIPKPFDPCTLNDRVQSIWDELHGRKL
jgi:CheY-like chemotaxis protein